jgi:hypothetical protein
MRLAVQVQTRLSSILRLSGATITLTAGVALEGDGDAVTIDASAHSAGITIHGNNSGRVVSNGGMLTLRALSLTFTGGAIYNRGSTILVHCTVVGNESPNYGGIFNEANYSFIPENSIVAGNTGNAAGDILNADSLDIIGAPTLLRSPFTTASDQSLPVQVDRRALFFPST